MVIESKEQLFYNILNESMLLNEKRIELQNDHPVTRDGIIRFFDISERIQWRGKYDDKKLRIYIESTDRSGKERYDLLGEVEPTSIGYILHGRDGHYYQGESYEDFKSDMMDAIRHFDSNVFDTLGGSGEDVLNEEFKEAAYNLGRFRLYCGLDETNTRWDHDDDDLPYIVDSKNKPPLFTIKWIDTEEHPKSYAISDGKTTEFFSDKESAYEKINDIIKQSSVLEETKDQLFGNILNESIDDAGYALTKLKGYLNFNIRWEYDGDGEPYLVDNENEPPLYTVQWTETESGSRQGYYSVEVKQDEEWDSTIYNFSDVRSTYQKIEDIMRQRSALLERKGDFKKKALFDKLLKE